MHSLIFILSAVVTVAAAPEADDVHSSLLVADDARLSPEGVADDMCWLQTVGLKKEGKSKLPSMEALSRTSHEDCGSCRSCAGCTAGESHLLQSSAAIQALRSVSEEADHLGLTMTVFDACGRMAFQHTVGSYFCTRVGCPAKNPNYSMGWTADTVHGIFSISKMISAATFMRAVIEPGAAHLDSPLKRLLPDIFGGQNAYGTVTPRQIMSHTSGFPGDDVLFEISDCFRTYPHHRNHNYSSVPIVTLEGCVQQLSNVPQRSAPGTRFEYSNSGFEVIALLIDRLTGMTLEEAFQKYIGLPLNMNSTSYNCPMAGSTVVHAHAAMGICTTANDLSKFTQLMFRGGEACGGDSLLARSSAASILSEQTRNAILYGDIFFTSDWARSRCVTNTLEGNVSNTGYGFGAIHSRGFRSMAWYHPGAMGSFIWLNLGKYAALFSTSYTVVPMQQREMRILDAFESQNFPGAALCPSPEIKLDGEMPTQPLVSSPWQNAVA